MPCVVTAIGDITLNAPLYVSLVDPSVTFTSRTPVAAALVVVMLTTSAVGLATVILFTVMPAPKSTFVVLDQLVA